MTSSIFHYQDYHAFLRDSLSGKISTRSWAKKLGFNSPSHLVMILQGKRRFPASHFPSLTRALGLKSAEAKYLEDLIHFQHAKSSQEKAMYDQRLRSNRVRALGEAEGSKFVSLDFESFRLIQEPIHYFILEMTLLRGFTWDAHWILRRLGAAYRLTQVRDAMERLLAMKLVTLAPNTSPTTVTKSNERLTTTHDVPNAALRESHKALIEMALNSIESQHVQERDITSSTLTLDAAKLPLAKEMLKNFRRAFCKALEAAPGEGTHTYQINLQMFRITQPSIVLIPQKKQSETLREKSGELK